jgi:hypothetical protein
MSEPRIVTFETPVTKTVTTEIPSVEVLRVNVDVKNKRLYIVMTADGSQEFTRCALKTDETYDSSAVQNFWPVVEGLVNQLAADGELTS